MCPQHRQRLAAVALRQPFAIGAEQQRVRRLPGNEAIQVRDENLPRRFFLRRFCEQLQRLPLAIVCAVNGADAGAGASLALAADVTLAARKSFFLLPFVPRLGILPDLGLTWFAARGVSRARAMGMMLFGERLPAETAAQWGLIWSCVDDDRLMEDALALARRLAELPGHGALQARQALQAAYTNSLNAQ